MGGKYYFSYHPLYYKPILILATYFISFLSFAFLFVDSRIRRKVFSKIEHFSLFLTIVSFTLVVNAKGPFGFVFRLLYDYVPAVMIYREPYAKFMPLFVFAMAINLVVSLYYVSKYVRFFGRIKVLSFLLLISVILSAFPVFSGQAIYVRKWNEGSIGSVVKIPSYWREAAHFLEGLRVDSKVFVLPYNEYVNRYNWEFGVNVVGNVSEYLADKPIVRGFDIDFSPSGIVANNVVFSGVKDPDVLNRYLGFLNIGYVFSRE